MADEVCASCTAYRAGEVENAVYAGMVIHGCDKLPEEFLGDKGCPCGCEMREPGRIGTDREMYGNCFLNHLGGRIDPRSVTAI